MPRSRQPTENELNGIFGGFFSHDALSGLFFLYRSFVYISWSVTVFTGLFVGVCMSLHLYVFPMLYLWPPFSVCFCSSLYCPISLYCCLFCNEKEKEKV